jgi:hypothetical protein
MKHLESGNDKGHIMELLNFKENFSFFNSLFNSNLDFFFTFFNMENQDKISNLDKIDINEYKKSSTEYESSNNPERNIGNSFPYKVGSVLFVILIIFIVFIVL